MTTKTTPPTPTGLQLQSLVKPEGLLEISLVSVPTPTPAADEVVVRIEATPINPSDIGLLFGAGDIRTATLGGSATHPVVTMQIPPAAMKAMAGRLGQALPVGNEGAGVVVAAGSAPAAQALLGKTVATLGGAMYAQYRCVKAEQCLPLPEGTTPAEGASCFVNPLTALGMVETMRREGHTALVHTAAASNLGQMLNRICLKDGIGLVNIVRKPEQAALLKSQGAVHVCDASSPTFIEDLTQALVATGATLAFDATGGGKLAGQILGCMEAALNRTAKEYSRYGSTTHKQVYVYGGLDTGPTEFNRNFGMAWGMGGWLLFPFLQRIGPVAAQALRQRVADELKTTFASSYSKEISLTEALQPAEIAVYGQRATGTKYLLNPNKGLVLQPENIET
ncbi:MULTISPECIES: zinc-binding dehydrogenase [unclassified Polaromonas]|jgi:NADPH2:quinone reductase|uniref:zinc-binding dehydrogenase n=1 Tax=unclassified Polaromonas TaxID=2638319 RepID=UPI000BD29F66|nr:MULTISPECIES: zinc-binding dehydrogenase [unclassified Polaromonas]OYY35751.1 MAG: NADH oxidase [Polaromonas sp. 35-63-35]OYZ19945.1 MAG: NADH oxidase [Polaromonas sp. 16-63-31]OYZ76821.1 MAG: NADH oxidase [Polaromonas sp. 24-63-21]OZA51905.1 MAG: NADH oxidase [Polaromonas sp. 17-63-33]OZA88064.1 MAG: NADH oxidase [Polaromonas sp. 39-63-25]